MSVPMLSRYEVARLVGLRALQLEHGDDARVQVEDATLRCDVVYVAALELFEGRMDAIVRRGDIDTHVSRTHLPADVATLLSIRDGRPRP